MRAPDNYEWEMSQPRRDSMCLVDSYNEDCSDFGGGRRRYRASRDGSDGRFDRRWSSSDGYQFTPPRRTELPRQAATYRRCNNTGHPLGAPDRSARWRHLEELRRRLLEHGPFDILHGHSSKAGALVRLLPASGPGARAYTPHAIRTMDPTLPRTHRALYAAMEKMLSYRPGRFVSGSSHEIAALRRLGIPDDRIDFLQFGIEPGRRFRATCSRVSSDSRTPILSPVSWGASLKKHLSVRSRRYRVSADRRSRLRSLGRARWMPRSVRWRMRPAWATRCGSSATRMGSASCRPSTCSSCRAATGPHLRAPRGADGRGTRRHDADWNGRAAAGGGRAGRLVENTDDPAPWVEALASLLEPGALEGAKAEARALRASILSKP